MLEGKVAVITGSTSGIGLAIAEALAAKGCAIMLNGFAEQDRIDERVDGLKTRFGVAVRYDAADLRTPPGCERLVRASVDAFGSVDILVNNAAVRHFGPIEEFKTEHWDESLAVNLSAAFHMTRLALPLMRSREWGRIVNMASALGFFAASDRVDYITTKTALLGLTRAVAIEVAKTDITCNAICPGTTLTPPIESRLTRLMEEESLTREQAMAKFMEHRSPAGRFVKMESLAAMVVFLCGVGGEDVNGAALPIDLAWTAGR
ncbi:MAG: SDR family NAD(P)-dependent oxidoreductase [Hyphomicrobiales bacterium]|nr:SDR family NAD(P)-dependent oxidoreductase [Hyphomicrobiales bacterium]